MGFATIAAIALAGLLIGATGIGGVLVVPALTAFAHVPVDRAIAAAAFAFGFPGVAALFTLRHGKARVAALLPLIAGALAGALGGAMLVKVLDARWLLAGIAALVLFAGTRGLLVNVDRMAQRPAPGSMATALLGAFVGVGSGLTGTGGPVLLIPLMMFARQPLALTIAAAQAIQLPIAAAATIVHASNGTLDWRLGCIVGIVLLLGSLGGHWAGKRLDTRTLQKVLSALLVAIGAWLGWLVLQG